MSICAMIACRVTRRGVARRTSAAVGARRAASARLREELDQASTRATCAPPSTSTSTRGARPASLEACGARAGRSPTAG
eukprot:908043-Prymnesium_polylepis.1